MRRPDVRRREDLHELCLDQPDPAGNQRRARSAKVTYSPGGVGDIEVVTLYYAWPIYVSLLGNNLADMGNNRLLVATAVFRNEPYQ